MTWTTHIQSITPRAGIAGMTEVVIQGYCFGDSPGTVTIGKAQVTHILLWTDFEIELIVPFGATTGDLVVTSQYGKDDSATESICCGDTCSDSEKWPFGTQLCGNDVINKNFDVVTPNPPLYNANDYPPELVFGLQDTPRQYVSGSWYVSDGGGVRVFTLAQVSQDSSGIWTITGTEWNNIDGIDGLSYPVSGEMDKYGDVVISSNYDDTCYEYQILDSGDVTSPGWSGGQPGACPAPQENFLLYLFVEADEGPWWDLVVPPAFKSQNSQAPLVSQTDLPSGETPQPYGWVALYNPQNTDPNSTYGQWKRTLSPLSSSPGGSVAFSGRSVYEQTGSGGATDTCSVATSPTPTITGVKGGGWYVYGDDTWEWDYIGMDSKGVDWYQQNVALPCQFTVSQDMYIDARIPSGSAPPFQMLKYTTNQLTFEIDAKEIFSEVQPEGGTTVKECEYYSNSTVGKRKRNP